MASRPYCLRCGSPNVGRDDDAVNGFAAIACMNCGARQYRGGPAMFEMREGPA